MLNLKLRLNRWIKIKLTFVCLCLLLFNGVVLTAFSQTPGSVVNVSCLVGETKYFFSAGEADNFNLGGSDGPNLSNQTQNTKATPSPTLKSRLKTNSPILGFDEPHVNTVFAHTFSGLPLNITQARFEIRLKPLGELWANDTLALEVWNANSSSFTTRDRFPLSSVGVKSVQTTYTVSKSLANFIGALHTFGELDVVVQDDTSVDWVSLTLCAADPDFSIEKSVIGGPFEIGELVTYKVQTQNLGPGEFGWAKLLVFDTLPEGLEFVSATKNTAWDCKNPNPQIYCLYIGLYPILPGVLPEITITAKVIGLGPIENCAQVILQRDAGGVFKDANPTNDKSCVSIDVKSPDSLPSCKTDLISDDGGVNDKFEIGNGDDPPFDSKQNDSPFSYTFGPLPVDVVAATVVASTAPLFGNFFNDNIRFGPAPAINLPSVAATISYVLTQQDISEINSTGSLTVSVQDDTSVDYLAVFLCIKPNIVNGGEVFINIDGRLDDLIADPDLSCEECAANAIDLLGQIEQSFILLNQGKELINENQFGAAFEVFSNVREQHQALLEQLRKLLEDCSLSDTVIAQLKSVIAQFETALESLGQTIDLLKQAIDALSKGDQEAATSLANQAAEVVSLFENNLLGVLERLGSIDFCKQ